jgi:hypothetical protein
VRSILLALLALGSVVAACSPVAVSTADRQPKPCAVVYPVARCQAMTDLVAEDVGKNRDDVVSVSIVPDAPPGGVHLSAGWHIRVRLSLTDGRSYDKLICGGVLHEAACMDETRLRVRSSTDDGAAGGAPDVPSVPMVVSAMSIPIDHLGGYEIELGEDSAPSAGWTSGSLQFAVPWPDDVALRDASVTLDLRTSAEHQRPSLAFDVLWFRPGATLEVRDLVVR